MSRSVPQAILWVDGYNVVGHWRDLKHIRDNEGLGEARRSLTEQLTSFSAYYDYETRLVFDAQYQDTPSSREVITSYLSVHYTDFGQTADTYIEKACAAFRNDIRKFHQRLIVATSDRAHQLTVVGYGAECISAEQLAAQVDAMTLQVRRKRKAPPKNSGRFLANALDPIALKRLSDMRFGK